jgi:peptidoglycan/LPS O-acetylase OafA/YrhL
MNYIRQIDGLRFVAIFLVLAFHFAPCLDSYESIGYFGVDLFFVISGFLITGILLRTKDSFAEDYKNFLGRRALRIFPLYYATLLVLFITGNSVIRNYFPYFITYTYNYAYEVHRSAIPHDHSNMVHFWSLAVEEQFYLTWPCIVLLLRNNITLLKRITLFVIIVCLGQYYFLLVPSWAKFRYVGIIPRAYSLLLGALGAIGLKQNKLPLALLRSKYMGYAAMIILFAVLIIDKLRLTFLLSPLLALFIVLKTTNEIFLTPFINRFLSHKAIVYLGLISYGIYVFHLPIAYYGDLYLFDVDGVGSKRTGLSGFFPSREPYIPIMKLFLYTVLSIVAAHLSYKFFESPILALKDRFFKYRSSK